MNNLRADPQYRDLAALIKRHSNGSTIDFSPSPGNWGDALINLGTEQFLEANGIPYKIRMRDDLLHQTENTQDSMLVVGGGGGWCSLWSTTGPFVARVCNNYRVVLVLPSSYERPQLMSVVSCENVILVSRELDVPDGHPDNMSCHDMAFFIDRDEKFSPELHAPKFSRIHAFREDVESKIREVHRPRPNYDLSLLGNSYDAPNELFSLISRFANVSTDRLHIAIAACLLGINSRVYESAVKKIPNVHLKSIQDNYPNCKLFSLNALDTKG